MVRLGCHGMLVSIMMGRYRLSSYMAKILTAVDQEGRKECFWGFDRIGQVAAHLGLEKPAAGDLAERGWKAML